MPLASDRVFTAISDVLGIVTWLLLERRRKAETEARR